MGKLILAFIPPALVAGMSAIVTMPAINSWYTTLRKPVFIPPYWIFAPVWTTLFFLMGIAWYLVWISSKKKEVYVAGEYFFLQLGLNLLWSVLFFAAHWPFGALVDIVLLWISIFLTIKYFLQVSKLSGYLLLPYLLWVSFATIP